MYRSKPSRRSPHMQNSGWRCRPGIPSGGPVIIRQPQDGAFPVGSAASLDVQALSRSHIQYQWRFNGTNLTGATNASLTFTALAASDTGPYSVVVRDAVGPIVSRTAVLRVLTDAPYVARQPVSQSVNQGDRVLFRVEAVGAEPRSYQWLHNGAVVNGATQSDFVIPTTAPADAGIYAVEV